MNSIREIQALNQRELENCVSVSHLMLCVPHVLQSHRPSSASWHTDYRDTAYIYIGGLSFDLTEGDIITIFSQFGEPVWLKLARDKETGKSKGFAFLKYEDQRSTDLAVDNFSGATVLDRTIRVDHTRYKKRDDENDEEFDVTVRPAIESLERSEGKLRHRHHHRRHRHRAESHERASNANKSHLEDRGGPDSDDEDPMRDYLARERKKGRGKRDGRERRHRSRELLAD